MLPIERHELILRAVSESKHLSINEVRRLTNSSLSTVHRDVDYLTKNSNIKRIVGGITLLKKSEKEDGLYMYNMRARGQSREKEAIGKAAQKFINDKDCILIINGTTTTQVARYIDPTKQLSIITNGLDIISALSNKPNVEVIVLGGVVDFAQQLVTGPSVVQMLSKFHFSKIITGVGGISKRRGMTNYNCITSSYFNEIIQMTDELIVVADYTKIGREVLVQCGQLDRIKRLVTNKNIPEDYIEIFLENRIDYVLT